MDWSNLSAFVSISDLPFRFIVRIMCSVLGMHVRQNSPRLRDKDVKLYISNHVTQFDHNIINLLTSCSTVSFYLCTPSNRSIEVKSALCVDAEVISLAVPWLRGALCLSGAYCCFSCCQYNGLIYNNPSCVDLELRQCPYYLIVPT